MRRGSTLAAVASALALGAGSAGAAEPGPPELISAAAGGIAGNGPSLFPAVSEDGRFVAFRSEATNLVADDVDSERDIFLRDRQTGQVTLISRATGPTGVKGNRASFNPRISASGRFVVFRSNANNLVPEDTDQLEDVYVRDVQANTTTVVSRAATAVGAKGNGGSFNPSISADGRYIAFRSEATNLHPEDLDTVPDVYVRDMQTNELTLASRASGATGAKGTVSSEFPVISADGSRVAFRSESPNLHPDDIDGIEDIFLRDLRTQETFLVSRAAGTGPKGNARSTFVSVSEDGSVVAFDSQSSNLHPDDTLPDADVFVRDIASGALDLVSRGPGELGPKAVPGSSEPAISADGRTVAFQSAATNLDPDDTDGTLDVYLRDLETFRVEALSPSLVNPYNRSFEPQIAADAGLIAFHADAGTASTGPSVPPSDVFASLNPKPEKCLGKKVTLYASAGAVTKGTTGADVIMGGEGEETIKPGKGKDRVCAEGGDDVVLAGGGADRVKAGEGDDVIDGKGGADELFGKAGRDRLDGGGGSDLLSGGRGRDRCDGGGGADELKGCEVDKEKPGGKGKGDRR